MARGSRSVVIDAWVNGLAGGHGIVRSVMQLVARMDPGGLPLRVLVNPGPPQLFPLSVLPGHAEVIVTDIPLFAFHRCRQLARLLRDADAGALWVPHPLFTPLVRPCPVVVTVHDCICETDTAFAGGWARQAGQTLATRTVLRRSAASTPPQASAKEIRHFYPFAPRLTVIPSGVDPAPFAAVTPAEVDAARRRYRLPGRFVLTVGARRPHKNHEVLIRAPRALPEQISLVIVGYPDTGFRDPLPGLLGELGPRSRVLLVLGVDDGLLPAVYRAASVFAFPSMVEGYGLPVLEAMASGVPVAASDIPALAEVAGDGAVFVPPSDPAAWAEALGAAASGSRGRSLPAAWGAVAAADWGSGARLLRDLLESVAAG